MSYTIKKLDYSSRPWRLLSDGREVWVKSSFDHPDMGMIEVDEPFAADSKAELVDKVLAALDNAVAHINGMLAMTSGGKYYLPRSEKAEMREVPR